jgi:hypothetical protein
VDTKFPNGLWSEGFYHIKQSGVVETNAEKDEKKIFLLKKNNQIVEKLRIDVRER